MLDEQEEVSVTRVVEWGYFGQERRFERERAEEGVQQV